MPDPAGKRRLVIERARWIDAESQSRGGSASGLGSVSGTSESLERRLNEQSSHEKSCCSYFLNIPPTGESIAGLAFTLVNWLILSLFFQIVKLLFHLVK